MDLDLYPLQHAISTDQPCGVDLAFSQAFHDIKIARTHDDVLLDQGDWITEPKQADWSFVALKSTELLSQQTKDIRLLTWLTEAWSHLYGFAGIAAAIELSHQLLQQYWTEIHPRIEDQDLDQRLGLLQGLLNQLPTLIKLVPLNQQQPCYNLLDYENILYQHNNRLKHSETINAAAARIEIEQFELAIATNSESELRKLDQEVTEILKHWEQLKQVLDQLMAHDAPRFSHVDTQLQSIQKNIQKVLKIDHSPTSNAIPTVTVRSPPTTPPSNLPMFNSMADFKFSSQNHCQNRQQALLVLQEISDYFELHEPHSPVSYMLKKTIHWSQLPLHEWLTQVIKNENPLESIQELLGVQSNRNESTHG